MNHPESLKNHDELLTNHSESSTKKKHLCPHCKKGYSTNSNMNKHKRTCKANTQNKQEIDNIGKVGKMPIIKSKEAPNIEFDKGMANTAVLCGSSKRGKSTLMVAIYNKYFKDNDDLITILISPSCHIDIFDKLPKKIFKINKFGRDTAKLIKALKRIQNRTKNAYRFLLMIDDCVDLRYSKVLDDCILTMRNSEISTIISIQYSKIISPQSRASLNQVLVFAQNTDQSINSLLDSFFRSEFRKITKITNKEDLVEEFREITQKSHKGHSFLLYNVFDGILSHHLLQL